MKGKGRPRSQKLAARQRDYDAMRGEDKTSQSKWVRMESGKNSLFHRPGSNKGKG